MIEEQHNPDKDKDHENSTSPNARINRQPQNASFSIKFSHFKLFSSVRLF